MLINCPKCGFEQPKDDYCAKCGVHIPSFKVPEPSLPERATRSGAFYTFLIIVLAIGSTYYFTTKFKGFDDRIDEYNINQLNELVEADSDNRAEREELVRDKALTTVVDEIGDSIKEAVEKNKGPKSIKDPVKEKINWNQYSISFSFVEAPNNLIDDSGEIRQEGPDYQITKYLTAPKSNELWADFRLIDGGSVNLSANQWAMLPSEESSSQFAFEAAWKLEENRILLELVSSYNIQSEVPLSSGVSFSDYLKPGQLILLKGLLPKTPIEGNPNLDTGPLSIYNSQAFLEDDSDFFILIRLESL
jgi:hypothetical protein